MTRTVWRMTLGGRSVYVKRQRLRGAHERLKYAMLPSRPEVEWRVAHALARGGIAAAEPLAVGEARRGPWLADAVFVCAEVPGVEWSGALGALRARERSPLPLVRATVAVLRQLEQERWAHRDLHVGNLIVKGSDEEPSLVLIDLHAVSRARSDRGPWRDRMRGKFAHALWTVLEPEEFEQALPLVAPGEERRLRRRVRALERVRLRSRSRRCTVSSSVFTRERADGWRVWRRREVPAQALLALARTPGGRSRVERVPIAGVEREVRVLRRPGPTWLPTWKGLHALHVRQVPAFEAYACLERRSLGRVREAILVVEEVPGLLPLERVASVSRGDGLERRALHTAVHAHRAGITTATSDLYAAPEAEGWRVLRKAIEYTPSDRPLPKPQAARELEALREVTRSSV